MVGSKRLVVMLASVGLAVGGFVGVEPAVASHFQCSGYAPVWVSGAPGVEVAVDADLNNWGGICVFTRDAAGNRTSFFSAKVGLFDEDPSRPGAQVRFGTCGDPAGDCSAVLFSTGAEVGAGFQCDHGQLQFCKTGSSLWANGSDVPLGDEPGGVAFDEDIAITDGAVVCPFLVCYQEQRIQIGTLHAFIADGLGGFIHEDADLCVQVGDLGPDCHTVPGT
ncbi:MAG: hypothetical protein ACLGH3_03930 [Actinomycetota bacterium]